MQLRISSFLTGITLILFFTTIHATPMTSKVEIIATSRTSEKCSITQAHNLIVEARGKNEEILDIYRTLSQALTNFQIIEDRLSGTCKHLEDRKRQVGRFSALLEPATYIPNLNTLVKPVQKLAERLNLSVLKQPTEALCKAVSSIRTQIDAFNESFKDVETVLQPFLTVLVDGYDLLEDGLTAFEAAGGHSGTECIALNSVCNGMRQAAAKQKAILNHILVVSRQMESVEMKLHDIKARSDSVFGAINKVFGGAVGSLMQQMEKLMNTQVSLPIPRGSKARGTGVIPRCCPSGYTNTAGLCYQNCRSGYTTAGLVCLERCPSGWKDIGVACAKAKKCKKVFRKKICVKPVINRKKAYSRFGRAPATFGNTACSCRRDRRYLESGLCYNKCGRDHFRDYPVTVLTNCFNFSPTKFTITQLANQLNVFEQAKKIPVLGNAINGVFKLIETAFAPITAAVLKLANISLPKVDLVPTLPTISGLDALKKEIDSELGSTLQNIYNSLTFDEDCRTE